MELIYLSLAVFALSFVLVYKDGLFDIFARIRPYSGGMLECLPCTSFWVSLCLVPHYGWLTAGAVWGACILLDLLAVRIIIK